MASTFDYAPGDVINIFTPGNTWGPGTVRPATVERITPSGQIVARIGEREVRFTADRGREVGGSHGGWSPTGLFVLPRAEADARAAHIHAHVARERLQRDTKCELEDLRRLDASDPTCRADLIRRLRALTDKLEAADV